MQCLNKKNRRALARTELEAVINECSNDDTEIANICIVPPSVADDITDEEDINDDLIAMYDVGIF